jgi:hypothetical protein
MSRLTKQVILVSLMLVSLSFITPYALGDANLAASPPRIAPGETVTLTITSTDDGTCIDEIIVTGPDGITTWTYDYAETTCIDVITGALVTGIQLNNTETDVKVFGPGGDFGDTTLDGRYRIEVIGTDGFGYFDASRSFIVPEFALPVVIGPAAAFAYISLKNRRKRRNSPTK